MSFTNAALMPQIAIKRIAKKIAGVWVNGMEYFADTQIIAFKIIQCVTKTINEFLPKNSNKLFFEIFSHIYQTTIVPDTAPKRK